MDLNTITEIIQPKRRENLPPWRDGDAWLAGGTWLYSEPQSHLRRLIDLTSLRWPAVEVHQGGLRIAATCTIARLDGFALPVSWAASPLIGHCCHAFLASFKIWNTATIGGNICMSLPAGPMISLFCALDGIGTIWSRNGGERRIPVIEFVAGPRQNALGPGDILRQIDIPASALMRRAAFRQISLAPLGRSAALLIGTLSPSGGSFDLTVTASTVRPIRLSFAGLPDADALRHRLASDIGDPGYFDDVHGAPLWRKQVTAVLAEEIRQELSAGGDP